MDDLPPLEPIPSEENARTLPTTGNRGAGAADGLSGAEQALDDNEDVDMPPAIDPAFDTFVQPAREEDGNSMPSLRSVSDSSDESNGSVDEVEMLPVLQPVEDDDDSSWTDYENDPDDLPPLEPIAGSRRARVEHDEDDDRDRRHPTQRTINGRSQSVPNIPPRANPAPEMFDIFQSFMGAGGPPQAQAGNAGGNGNNRNPDPGQQPGVPPLQFTFGMGDGAGQDINGAFPPPGLVDLLFPDMTPEQRANPFAQFQAFLERLGALGQAFGFPMEEEKEDPERAKKLVAGLEVVPVGLVRRMERVGGAPGGHVDDSTGEVEVPGCAICWDKLLDAEGDGFKTQQSAEPHDEEASAQPVTTDDGAPAEVSMNEQPPAAPHISETAPDPSTPVIALRTSSCR